MSKPNNGPLSWRIRRAIWSRYVTTKFHLNKPQTIVPPKAMNGPVTLIPFNEKYPRIPIRCIPVYRELPKDERRLIVLLVIAFQRGFNKLLRQMQRGLPEIDADIRTAHQQAYTGQYRTCLPAPRLPEGFEGDSAPDLAAMALAGPFSFYLRREDGGGFVWDFTHMGQYEHHRGLISLGLKVEFQEDTATSYGLKAVCIRSAYGDITPDHPGWDKASRLALASACTEQSLTRHFNYIHLVCANHFSTAIRNNLPPYHPITMLLWPTAMHSFYTNEGVTAVQLDPDGDFENAYSFTHKGLCDYFTDQYPKFRASMIDPRADWAARGLTGTALKSPAQTNLVELFELMESHTQRWVMHYYQDDNALNADTALAGFLAELNRLLPGGLADYGEPGAWTRDGLARLAAAFLYVGTTLHAVWGQGLWDFQMWVDKIPVRVYEDGRRIPLDVFQRFINVNFILHFSRAMLLENYDQCASDPEGAALWRTFLDDCELLQARYDREGPWPVGHWEPRDLEVSMNG